MAGDLLGSELRQPLPFTRTHTHLIMKNTTTKHGARKQARTHVYVYHWDRIIGAAVVFLVLVGLLGYRLYLWSDSSPKEESDMAETLSKAAVAEVDSFSPALAEITDSNSNSQDKRTPLLNKAITAEDNPAQQFSENKPLETEPSSPKMANFSTANHTNEETLEAKLVNEKELEDSQPAKVAQPSEDIPAIPIKEGLSEHQAEIPQNTPLQPQRESPESAVTTRPADSRSGHFQLKELKILEPSVKRFLLAGSVSNREPKGELNEISFTADGSAAVWVYSEIIDKKGSRYKYIWLHGGNPIATIPVNVGSNRWRSYSSKNIKKSMSGHWRVELQDGEGRLLANVDFFLE